MLQRPEGKDGFGKAGTYTTDEKEIDQIARNAWSKVYNGNIEDINAHVKAFMQKYDKYIFKSDKKEIGTLNWQDVKQACLKDTDSSGGLDAWTKKELQWVSDEAFKLLTEWMKTIERTRRWPSDQCKARAVFLSKNEDERADPMAYRIRKSPRLYRVSGRQCEWVIWNLGLRRGLISLCLLGCQVQEQRKDGT